MAIKPAQEGKQHIIYAISGSGKIGSGPGAGPSFDVTLTLRDAGVVVWEELLEGGVAPNTTRYFSRGLALTTGEECSLAVQKLGSVVKANIHGITV